MKIKGIVRKKGPGVKRGDIIELSSEEKVPLAVQEAVSEHAVEGQVWCTCRTGFTLDGLQEATLGPRKDGKKWANNSYAAKGKVTWWSTKLGTEKKSKNKVSDFKIEFTDSLDHLGQPDLKITNFEMR